MDYKRIYDAIIDRAKARHITSYYETHHIIPKCIGGSDESSNLVNLTPEEHYIAHQLLCKMYPDNIGLFRAAIIMCCGGNGMRINNKVYGWLKIKLSEYMKGENNPSKKYGVWNKGMKLQTPLRKSNVSELERIAISKRMKENNPCSGVKPWDHPRATSYTKSVWANANLIRTIWLNNNMPSYGKLYSLVNGKPYGKDWVSIGPYMNLVKYFRNDWIPEEDSEWNTFVESMKVN